MYLYLSILYPYTVFKDICTTLQQTHRSHRLITIQLQRSCSDGCDLYVANQGKIIWNLTQLFLTIFIFKNLGTLVHVDNFFFFFGYNGLFIKACPIISSTGRVGLMFHFRIHPLPLDLQPGAWHHAGLLKEGDDVHYLTAADLASSDS